MDPLVTEPLSLETFERLVYRRAYEPASRMLLQILDQIEKNWSFIGSERDASEAEELRVHTRLAAAAQALLLDPAMKISDPGYQALVAHNRNLTSLFTASGLGGASHLPALFGLKTDEKGLHLPPGVQLGKLLAACGPGALPTPLVRAFPKLNPELTLPATLALLSNRAVLTPRGEANRRLLLAQAELLDRGSLPDHPSGWRGYRVPGCCAATRKTPTAIASNRC